MDSLQLFCANCGAANTTENTICWFCKQSLQDERLSQSSSSDNLLNNRYRILEIVGRGGMGTVYKAADVRLGGRFVALKEMIPQGSQSSEELTKASQAFEREALLLAQLNHPYLPSIYDHFNSDGHWYLAMEYITGKTLSQLLHSMPGRHLPFADALDIGIKLCIVLGYLHSQKPPIVFGDLKPDNIMLTSENDLYLIDFGIARLFQDSSTYERAFVSQGYSAPEQYLSAHISPRADIYSLGATLYQMFSGNHPVNVINGFAPLQLGHQLWAMEIEALVINMMEPDEQKRSQDITTIKQALQDIVKQQAQELGFPQNSPSWGGGRSTWAWEPTISSPGDYSPTISSPGDYSPTISMPSSVSFQDIQLSLDAIQTLAWSQDGSLLAIAYDGVIQVYEWPSDWEQRFPEGKGMVPFYTWTIDKGQIASYTVMAWSPDNTHLAVAAGAELFMLNVFSEKPPVLYGSHNNGITAITWSPNGQFIASVSTSNPGELRIIAVRTKKELRIYNVYGFMAIAWSPNSDYFAIALKEITMLRSTNLTIGGPGVHIYSATTGKQVWKYSEDEDQGGSFDVAWSPDGTYLALCSEHSRIDILDAENGHRLRSLEGHTSRVKRVAFLDHGHLLASIDYYLTVSVWRTDTWAHMISFVGGPPHTYYGGCPSAFHPTAALIAPVIQQGRVRIFSLDVTQLLTEPSESVGIQYTNAKVVLVGDSGVGKSGLGLVLSGQQFEPTESTHARRVWPFERKEDILEDGRKEIREILLWDLAGQPGYRLVHQLHLSEVTVALVVFDAHSETDPFAGISHWVRALHTARRVRGSAETMKMFLVKARVDRGGRQVSRERIEELAQKWGFDGYCETSAKEGRKIDELATTIRDAIDWERLPKVTSTELFQGIKEFLLAEKQVGRLLSTVDDLYSEFYKTWRTKDRKEDFSAEFTTGIRLLESAGLIRQLSFGNLVLLQPELLDIYISALVNAVKDEPDGLGSILEETVRAGAYFIPTDQRIHDREREKLLLIAMLEDLLSYEIALREPSNEGPYLVFPSESTRENPDLPDPENVTVRFTFDGPIRNIYASLAVRLSHSGFFAKKELWKNAITYHARVGGICGLWLKVIDEGKGELTLFFDAQASNDTRFNFEEYVRVHLERKALSESVIRHHIFMCEDCGFIAPDQLVRKRTERGFNWFKCPVCENRVSLLDYKGLHGRNSPSQIPEMDREADIQRSRARAQATVQGKQETDDFDVFLCYNDKDQKTIIEIGTNLKEQGLLPWLDVWEQRPGFSWQVTLEAHIKSIKAAAVFVGKNGVAPWQQQQIQSLLREFVERKCPVIPVLLAGVAEDEEPELPLFLKNNVWVDFRKRDPDPMGQLVWGISGKRH